MTQALKILCIGNSFSEDSCEYIAPIGLAAGLERMLVANLYVGGCPIEDHFRHLTTDEPVYRYDRNEGSGWTHTAGCSIRTAIQSEQWDWIVIQHGSANGVRYTDPACYEKLAPLVRQIRELAGENTAIAFNMTWIGDPESGHHELLAYGGDQLLMYRKVCEVTETVVAATAGVNRISPTGTAVQNARALGLSHRMTRDHYHLSYDLGRYIAGLMVFETLSGRPVDTLRWAPEGVSEAEQVLALKAVACARQQPYAVTIP